MDTLYHDPKLAIEQAFVELLKDDTALAAVTGLDIVAASDRDALVGPKHVFVLCTEWAPATRGSSNGKATVAIGVVTDMDDDGEAVRRPLFDKVMAAVTKAAQPAQDYETGCLLIAWSVGNVREDTQGSKIMDVLPLSVAACLAVVVTP